MIHGDMMGDSIICIYIYYILYIYIYIYIYYLCNGDMMRNDGVSMMLLPMNMVHGSGFGYTARRDIPREMENATPLGSAGEKVPPRSHDVAIFVEGICSA